MSLLVLVCGGRDYADRPRVDRAGIARVDFSHDPVYPKVTRVVHENVRARHW